MKLRRIHFRGFGRWVDRTFELGEGLNLIEAPNEAGKSTLIQGLFALLYGAKREGYRQQRREVWYDVYKPWQGEAYGGEVDFSLRGKEYRLNRSLVWGKDSEQLVELKTGRDLSGDYPMDARRDRQFLKGLTGLSRNLFTRSTYFSSQALTGDQEMLEKMQQLMGEDARVEPVLNRVKSEIDKIGVRATGNRSYAIALRKQKKLREETGKKRDIHERQRESRQRLAEWNDRLNRLTEALREAKEQVEQWKKWKEATRERNEVLRELKHLGDHLKEAENIRAELENRKAKREQEAPPVLLSGEESEEIRQLLDRRSRVSEQIRQSEAGIREAEEAIRRLEAEKESLLRLAPGTVPVQLDKLKRVKEERAKLSHPEEETDAEELEALQKDEGELQRLGNEKEGRDREKSGLEAERDSLRERLQQAKEKKELESALSRDAASPNHGGLWLGAGAAGAVLSLILLAVFPPVGALALAGSAVAVFQGLRMRKDQKAREKKRKGLEAKWKDVSDAMEADPHLPVDPDRVAAMLDEVEQRLRRISEEQEQIQRRQQAILSRWEVGSATELWKLWKEKSADLEIRKRIGTLTDEVKEWASPFRERLGAFELTRWEKKISELGEEAEAARKRRTSLEARVHSLKEGLEQQQKEAKQLRAAETRWKEKLGSEDPAVWKDWIARSQETRRLDERIGDLAVKWEQWEAKRREEAWDQRQQEMKEKRAAAEKALEGADLPEDPEEALRLCSDRLTAAEADVRRLESEFSEVKGQADRLSGELNRIDDLSLGDLETALEEAEEEVAALNRKRAVLKTVQEEIREAAREAQEDLAPQLHPRASDAIGEVTGGRYGKLMVDPAEGFALSVFVPETGSSCPVEQLSRGTIDQMYFALRLALIRFISDNASIRLPLILDDSLVHFDEARLRQALRILGKVAGEHQVLLCTCQDREGRMLEAEGIPFSRHPLTAPGEGTA
ncbi:uncharacterized protein YhaN [Melghirimyces profundicolus]|uniref:Uncharacterized protein YhaN n=1 Tax=Melghirimyces profundicolus TaxID=1242148 RepID=A0A2T6C7Y6_9BACL|nr:AAA family ATPase [Melghirimyces profundicolus]PTX64424.1 uncharacterized protein YhaN [Melghirimyces profundicolus]